MVEPQPLLAVSGLTTEFDTQRGIVHAVNGVSFEIGDGEIVGLVGESGCGKSVTARSILGLTRGSTRVSGSIRFDGRELLGLSRREFRQLRGPGLSFVPQNPWGSLNPTMRIGHQFTMAIRAHRKASAAACDELAVAMLTRVGIPNPPRILRGYAHELSGGMAQRVVIAMAMILSPRLVIADEPTTGLDVTIQRQVLDTMTETVNRERSSMLLVTHDLGVVAHYCHRVIVMYAGKVVEVGPVAEVFVAPAHPYTEALLAAVPRGGRLVAPLTGSVPSLIDYPTDCPFRPRCRYFHEHERTDPPVLRPLRGAKEREVACHLPDGVLHRTRSESGEERYAAS